MKGINKPVVKPEIQHLTEVLSLINEGRLRVPDFQRPFVWTDEDMRELFESIYRGYPIGSLLFWEPQHWQESSPKIGPYEILESKAPIPNYILDGYQRVATLFGILTNKKDQRSKPWRWVIYYDLEKDSFAHLKNGNPLPHYIALHSLMKTWDFLKEAKRIEKECGSNASEYIEKAEKIAYSITNYKLAITIIKGGDIDSAVEIFSRLNSKGQKVSEVQMLNALTKNSISHQIEDILESLGGTHFSDVDSKYIMRAIFAASGREDIYSVKLERFVKNHKNLDQIVSITKKALLEAAKFLFDDCDLPGDKVLPYSLQLVFLSEFFRLCPNPSQAQKEKLKKWFWVTSFTGWFGGANSTKVKDGLLEIRRFALSQINDFTQVNFNEPAYPFPDSFHLRSARVRTFVSFLISLKPRSLDDGQKLDAKLLLGAYGHKALHHIKSIGGSKSLANRILLGPTKYGSAITVLRNKPFDKNHEIFQSHGINPEALQALQKNQYDKFIELRELELIKLEQEFMKDKGVVPNIGSSTEETIFDAT